MPKRKDVGEDIPEKNQLCSYCVHSVEDFPGSKQKDQYLLLCELLGKIVSPIDKTHKKDPKCHYEPK